MYIQAVVHIIIMYIEVLLIVGIQKAGGDCKADALARDLSDMLMVFGKQCIK